MLAELFCGAMAAMDVRYRRVALEHGARAIMHFHGPLGAAWEAARGWLAAGPATVAVLRGVMVDWLQRELEALAKLRAAAERKSG